MFRRHKDDPPHPAPPYKYGAKKPHDAPGTAEMPPPRIFDPPQHVGAPVEETWQTEKTTPLPHHYQGFTDDEEPETTLGEGVTFHGELSFERLLRIDGHFEGKLLSQGKVIVGPQGKVKANLDLREAIIEGEIDGNITCQERLELRGQAVVHGDIQAKSLIVDDGVTLVGNVLVTPRETP